MGSRTLHSLEPIPSTIRLLLHFPKQVFLNMLFSLLFSTYVIAAPTNYEADTLPHSPSNQGGGRTGSPGG